MSDFNKDQAASQESRKKAWNLRAKIQRIAKNLQLRVSACGRVQHASVGIRLSGGTAGFSGLNTCGSVWACPVCARKISARRAAELAQILLWARHEKHTLAMVTMTVRHNKSQSLEQVWDAISRGWERVTSGESWHSENFESFEERIFEWDLQGYHHQSAQNFNARNYRKPPRAPRGLKSGTPPENPSEKWQAQADAHNDAVMFNEKVLFDVPRAPRNWLTRSLPTRVIGDQEKYGVLGWARATEATYGNHGWHVHIHVVMVLEGNHDSKERADALGESMFKRWQQGIKLYSDEDRPEGFKDFDADEKAFRIDVSKGAEKRLAEYITKGMTAEKKSDIKGKFEAAAIGLSKEASFGQLKKGKTRDDGYSPGRSFFEIADVAMKNAKHDNGQDLALCKEWLKYSQGRHHMDWGGDLRELAGLHAEMTNEEIAAEEIGTEADSIAILPNMAWNKIQYRGWYLLNVAERYGAEGLWKYLDELKLDYSKLSTDDRDPGSVDFKINLAKNFDQAFKDSFNTSDLENGVDRLQDAIDKWILENPLDPEGIPWDRDLMQFLIKEGRSLEDREFKKAKRDLRRQENMVKTERIAQYLLTGQVLDSNVFKDGQVPRAWYERNAIEFLGNTRRMRTIASRIDDYYPRLRHFGVKIPRDYDEPAFDLSLVRDRKRVFSYLTTGVVEGASRAWCIEFFMNLADLKRSDEWQELFPVYGPSPAPLNWVKPKIVSAEPIDDMPENLIDAIRGFGPVDLRADFELDKCRQLYMQENPMATEFDWHRHWSLRLAMREYILNKEVIRTKFESVNGFVRSAKDEMQSEKMKNMVLRQRGTALWDEVKSECRQFIDEEEERWVRAQEALVESP